MATHTDTFTFDRSFPVSPARLWHLLTDAEQRESWGAPGEGTVLETITSDLRPGGVERHRCGPADTPDFEVETRWYHLDDGALAVFTETIEAGGMALGASLVTYAIGEAGKGSTLSATVAVSSFVGPEMIEEFRDGWTGGMDKLSGLAGAG